MSYARYAPIADAMRDRNALWRIVVGFLTILAIWIAVTLAMIGGGAALLGDIAIDGEQPVGALIFLLTIFGLWIGTWCAQRLWHRSSIAPLFGPRVRLLRHFVTAFAVTLGVFGIAAWLTYPPGSLTANVAPGQWVRLLPISLAVLLLQTGAEELALRGYLQARLAARFRSPLIWLILPSLLFGLMHFDATLPRNVALAFVAATTLIGVIAADLTARTGSLGAAWGLHFANNIAAVLIISYEGDLTGLALFTTISLTEALTNPLLILRDLTPVLIIYALLRWILRR